MRRALAALALLAFATVAHADPDPKRKVSVLEYRSGSSAMPGISARIYDAMSKQTSLQLSNLDATRTQYGADLDAMIVKCAGEAACIASIGKKVGAADVVLVAISELGDVILTVQRIDVAKQQAVTRIADSFAPGSSPSDDQVNGYLARLLAPNDFVRYGVIDIVANLAGAAVTVGGTSRGLTPIQPLKLPAPADYEVKVTKEGYEPFSTRIQLPPDGELKVEARLSKRGAGTAWYQKWYVLTVAGVLVAGTAGTVIYFATRDPADTVTVGGTL
ncbi:MAG: PEGA domain-containing protein [Kofleriaceae bacterium]